MLCISVQDLRLILRIPMPRQLNKLGDTYWQPPTKELYCVPRIGLLSVMQTLILKENGTHLQQ